MLTYSIVAGSGSPDASKFTIDSNGALSFISAPDFGNPTDTDHDNVYTVEIKVSDGTLSDVQTLVVNVTDVNEAPHAVNDVVITNNANNSTYRFRIGRCLPMTTIRTATHSASPRSLLHRNLASIDLTTHPGSVTVHDLVVGGSSPTRLPTAC